MVRREVQFDADSAGFALADNTSDATPNITASACRRDSVAVALCMSALCCSQARLTSPEWGMSSGLQWATVLRWK
jgi:hypothetical protein